MNGTGWLGVQCSEILGARSVGFGDEVAKEGRTPTELAERLPPSLS